MAPGSTKMSALAAALTDALAPLPGRFEASLRMLAACLLIVTLSMALQIPNAALSAYMVFFVSREDMATTAKTGVALALAVTAAIALTLLADLATIGNAPLRVALMTLLFCAGMFLSRVFVAGPLGFGLGFILLLTQSTVDLYPAAEPLVRDTLWTWLALCFAIAVVVLINVLLLPARPLALLRREVRRRLDHADAALAARLAGSPIIPSPPPAAGPARLLKLLALAGAGNARLRAAMPAYAAVARTLGYLGDAAFLLNTLPPRSASAPSTPSAHARLAALRRDCARLRRRLDGGGDPGADAGPEAAAADSGTGTDPAELSLLAEMAAHLRAIDALWPSPGKIPAAPPASPPPPARLFAADALSNPAHLRFALKASFAAMLCYVIYTGLAWPGIHTCVVTCAVVALTSEGATIHKAALRFAGALAGGALALLATVFIVPQLESIGGLLLLIAPVVGLSAWIAAGSERSAYFGWQLAFAFFLCILHGYGPNDDVTLVRDRLVGILLGIAVMAWVFGHVWPERADTRLRDVLARAERDAQALRAQTATAPMAYAAYAERRGAVLAGLAEAGGMAGAAAFERVFGSGRDGDGDGDGAALLAAARARIVAALQGPRPP